MNRNRHKAGSLNQKHERAHSEAMLTHSHRSYAESLAVERIVRNAQRYQDAKAQHGAVRVIMKDGVLLENK
jgi:hypothetical protein